MPSGSMINFATIPVIDQPTANRIKIRLTFNSALEVPSFCHFHVNIKSKKIK